MADKMVEVGAGDAGAPAAPVVVPLRPETLARLRGEYEALAAAQAAWQGGVELLAVELGVDRERFVLDFGVGFVERRAGPAAAA